MHCLLRISWKNQCDRNFLEHHIIDNINMAETTGRLLFCHDLKPFPKWMTTEFWSRKAISLHVSKKYILLRLTRDDTYCLSFTSSFWCCYLMIDQLRWIITLSELVRLSWMIVIPSSEIKLRFRLNRGVISQIEIARARWRAAESPIQVKLPPPSYCTRITRLPYPPQTRLRHTYPQRLSAW